MANKALMAAGIAIVVVLAGVAAWYFLYEGTVAVYVKDAVGPWEHVYVNFTGVSIHRSGASSADWVNLPIAAGTVDLANLTNTSKLLASLKLGPGHYEQIRIVVGSGYGMTTTGQTAVFSVPSGELKTNQQFNITSGKTTTLTLDVDLARSLVQTANGWIFTPVVGSVQLS